MLPSFCFFGISKYLTLTCWYVAERQGSKTHISWFIVCQTSDYKEQCVGWIEAPEGATQASVNYFEQPVDHLIINLTFMYIYIQSMDIEILLFFLVTNAVITGHAHQWQLRGNCYKRGALSQASADRLGLITADTIIPGLSTSSVLWVLAMYLFHFSICHWHCSGDGG